MAAWALWWCQLFGYPSCDGLSNFEAFALTVAAVLSVMFVAAAVDVLFRILVIRLNR